MASPLPPGKLSTRMNATVKALAPIAAAVTEKMKYGPGDINLSDGENTFMKTKMVEICQEAINKNVTVTTFANPADFSGDIAMRKALIHYLTKYFHPTIPLMADNIVPTAGSGNALDALFFTLCDPGDSIICPSPAWWAYGPFAQLHAEVTVIPAFTATSSSWWSDSLTSSIVPALEAAYNSAAEPKRIKALLTSNPNNPFMKCWPKHVVREMMDFCHIYGLHYISDEVFANTVFDPTADQFASALSLLKVPVSEKKQGQCESNDTVTIEGNNAASDKSIIDPSYVHVTWSATKDFGACGVRAGCVISYHPLVCSGVQWASVWQVSSLTAIFTSALLTSPSTRSLLSDVRTKLRESHQICQETLTSPELSGRVEYYPVTAGLWTYAKVILREKEKEKEKERETIQDVIAKAKENGVIISGVMEFNNMAPPEESVGWIKITFALPEEIVREGMTRLKESLLH